jgi:arginyl-tRNA synthetase
VEQHLIALDGNKLESDELVRRFRLSLVTATAQVLNNGLSLLGIEAPEEM